MSPSAHLGQPVGPWPTEGSVLPGIHTILLTARSIVHRLSPPASFQGFSSALLSTIVLLSAAPWYDTAIDGRLVLKADQDGLKQETHPQVQFSLVP